MAIILKDKTAPTACDACAFFDAAERRCNEASRTVSRLDRPRPSWCNIIEIPEGARLVDKSEIIRYMFREYRFETYHYPHTHEFEKGYDTGLRGVRDTPVLFGELEVINTEV